MKKILLTATILFSMYGFSQTREKGTIELTPLIGYGSSNYYSSEDINNSAISSINFGANGDYYFNNRWSLRSALLYQKMGSKAVGFKDELNYLTIPVNANWHFGSTRKWNLNFGPSAGFLMSAETNGIDIKDEANSFQLGFNIGIGYKIEVNENFGILIDYQGMSGLTEVAKDAPVSFKNSYGAFNIGAVLKL